MKDKEFRFSDAPNGKVPGLRWNSEIMESEYYWMDDPFAKKRASNVVDIDELRQRFRRPSLGKNFAGDFWGVIVPFRKKD